MTERIKQIRWMAQLAREPAWTAYAKGRAVQLEEIWPGITAEIRAEIERLRSLSERGKDGACERI